MKHWKIILSFVAVFLAGGLVGGTVVFQIAHRLFFSPPKPEEIARKILGELRSDLKLTPEQVAKIEPVLSRSTQEIGEIHTTLLRRMEEKFREFDEQVIPVLTPEQIGRYEKFKRRRPGPPPK